MKDEIAKRFRGYQLKYVRAFIKKGHVPVTCEDSDDTINIFGYSVGSHNGLKCSKCGWGECWHCNWQMKKAIPQCTGE